jgi:hypothetical protein
MAAKQEDKNAKVGASAVQADKQKVADGIVTDPRVPNDTTLPDAAFVPAEGRLAGTQLNQQGPAEGELKDTTVMPASGPRDPAAVAAGVQQVYTAEAPRNLPYERDERLVASSVERIVGPRKLPYVENQLVEALKPSYVNNRTYEAGDRFLYTGYVGENLIIATE